MVVETWYCPFALSFAAKVMWAGPVWISQRPPFDGVLGVGDLRVRVIGDARVSGRHPRSGRRLVGVHVHSLHPGIRRGAPAAAAGADAVAVAAAAVSVAVPSAFPFAHAATRASTLKLQNLYTDPSHECCAA